MAMDWAIILGNMQSLGLFQFVFPFLLVLAIAYGVLTYAAKDIIPKSARGLISIIIAFFVMNYSGSVGMQIATFFSDLFGGMLIVASGILVLIIILGLLGLKISDITGGEKKSKTTAAFVAAVIFIVFLIALGAGAGIIPGLTSVTLNSEFWTIIFFIVVLVIVLWVLGREGEGAAPAGGEEEK